MKDVTAVVVTYNRLKLLKKCLNHLIHQSYQLNKIIVINNNSEDNTKKFLESLNDPLIKVINLSENLGGAGGFSLGTKYAMKDTSSKFVWLMDDDTLPCNNSLSKMMEKAYLLHNNFGFLCSNVRWNKNGNAAITNIPQPAKDWNEPLITNLVKVKSASFVSLLVPRINIKKLGLPISDMFIWGDDVEFTTRLCNYNNRDYMVTDSIVNHESSINKSYNIVYSNRVKYYKYGIRNRVYIDLKYFGIKELIKYIVRYLIMFLEIPFLSKDNKLKRMYYIINGILKGFFFNPKIKYPKI